MSSGIKKTLELDDRHNDVLLAAFEERRKANKGKEIDNSKLYAGSPMYFYCRHCRVQTDVKSESYTDRPITICAECQVLVDKGLIK